MDSDLVNRAADEREKIFERYDLGRTAPVDPWEDPDYSIYSCVDRFGFVHDNKASASPQEDKKTLEKKLEILIQREKKWIKMLKNWEKKSTREKLHKRVYKGIPDKVRYSVWEKLLDLEKVMALESNRDVYQRMLIIARRHGTEARQIDSDVNRQFRENIFFRERYNLKQKQMFNVLVAYSMYNSEVGYCQGMSTLAGMLLMYFGEEETFWALNILLTDKKFAMHGLFILGFPKLTRFLAHHDAILTKFLPKLKRHFDQCNLDSILYSLKWFFVVFVERIPFSLCLRVWDIYLYEGERLATAMAYTVLKLHRNKLLKLKDMDSIVHYLQVKLAKDFGYDDDSVIKAYEQCAEELRKAKMDLPPPGAELEFPQKPFGVFVEPTREEIIGHRKTDFADIEKEVTGNVIKSREQTALELAENAETQAIDVGLCGSNSQLNTVQKPESEDGGSMLGSSKRSLAETSVTSTADLSIFSGGERGSAPSQQFRNDNVFENNFNGNENLIVSDIDFNNETIIDGDDADNGESSPNSMAKSSSTIQVYQTIQQSSPPNSESKRNSKHSSTTPTPTISNPDILRIYVPPPPDDSMPDIRKYEQRDRGDDEISQCSNRSSIIQVEYETLSFDRPAQFSSPTSKNDHIHSTATNGASKSQQNHQPQQYYYYPNPTSTQQSSSSRRGSMNRKTPSPLLGDIITVECDHMKHRRSQENFQDDSNSIGIKLQQININNNNNSISNNNGSGSLKRLTSFEEIARKSDSNSLYISEANDNNVRYNSNHSNKPRSDYGIYNSYKNLEGEFDQTNKNQMIMKKSTSHSYNIRRSSERKHSSSENNSPFDYDLLKDKKKDRYNFEGGSEGRQHDNDNSIKSYDRFFNSDDEMEDDEIKSRSTRRTHHKYRSHISGTEADDDDEENSSNSPTNKSIACTPLNDTMPLLSNDLEPHMSGYHNIPPPVLPSPATSSTSSLRSKSRIPRFNKNKSPGSGFTKNSSVSSPDGSDRSESFRNHSSVSYQTPIYRSDGISTADHKGSSRNASQRSDNKIRIKINQKN